MKGKLKLAWGMSVFLAKGAVFGQVVSCLLADVVMFRVFKNFIQLLADRWLKRRYRRWILVLLAVAAVRKEGSICSLTGVFILPCNS